MKAIPNEMQLKYYEEQVACFLHFGMNTFKDVEWGDGKASLEDFSLEYFDYDGYVKKIKELGFRRLIFTAKHHDGFCMWDSKLTDYKVTNTKYGKDFLELLSKSCSKYDMDMGIYLSPWDVHEPSYGSGDQYNKYYLGQIEEICQSGKYGNNGRFVEWWFDGAKDPEYKDQIYDFFSWMNMVRKYNPDILMFGLGSYGGIHWVGNENGYAMDPNVSRLPKDILDIDYRSMFKVNEDGHDKYQWSIAEADTCTTNGWFWHDNEIMKSQEELIDIYFNSVGKGAVLLLNIACDKQGKIPDALFERLLQVKQEIISLFCNSVDCLPNVHVKGNIMTLDYILDEMEIIRVIELREDIKKGQNIVDCTIYADDIQIVNFQSVGYVRLEKFHKLKVKNIRIIITFNGEFNLKEVKLYR